MRSGLVFHVVAQTTKHIECRSERGVFLVSVLQPEKSTGEKTRMNRMLLNSNGGGGYSRKHGNPFPSLSLSLLINNLRTLEWLLRPGNLCIPLFLDAGEARCVFWGDDDAQTWQPKRGMLPFFFFLLFVYK